MSRCITCGGRCAAAAAVPTRLRAADVLSEVPVVNGDITTGLYAFSDIVQVVDFDQSCCLNILSAKGGNILFGGGGVEISETGTYYISFEAMTAESIPLALTVNHGYVPGIIYQTTAPLCSGSIVLSLRQGDIVELTNKFSLDPITLNENIINTYRAANASVLMIKL